MNKLNVLVVDDDALARKVMGNHLKAHAVDFAEDKAGALKKIGENRYDVGFFDLMLGPGDDYSGLDIVSAAVERGVYPVVVSSSDSDEIVEKAYLRGCRDFYAKGNEEANVCDILRRYIHSRAAVKPEEIFSSRFVTADPATRATVLDALKYAPTDLPMLILGPSGSGKTALAGIIHDYSGRAGAFVAINCAAYTEDLLEAELFGYRKGAFTGADGSRKGRLLEADKGTLFLDEIGSMSLNMQTKLLKAIEEKTFHPVGSDKPEKSEFRIISATLDDPQRLIASGKMRFDLFQRIHGYTVTLPPLCRRPADIFPLIAHFTRNNRRLAFAPEAKAAMQSYAWPGNIRELRKFVELLSGGETGRIAAEAVNRRLKNSGVQAREHGSGGNDKLYSLALSEGLDAVIKRVSEDIIRRNLAENGGNKTKTMDALKISTRVLYASLPCDEKKSRRTDK